MGLFYRIESAIEKDIPALKPETELHTKIKTDEPEIQEEETSYQHELPQRKCESTVNTHQLLSQSVLKARIGFIY